MYHLLILEVFYWQLIRHSVQWTLLVVLQSVCLQWLDRLVGSELVPWELVGSEIDAQYTVD